MLVNALMRLGKPGMKAAKYLPELAMGIGAGLVVVAGVKCCKDTLDLEDVIDEARYEIEEAKANDANGRMMTIVYLKAGGRFIRLYGADIGTGLFGLAMMFYGFGVESGRLMDTIAAYKVLEGANKHLKGGVIDKYGKDAYEEIMYGMKREDVELEEIDEDGEVKTRKLKKTKVYPEDEGYSDLAVFFGPGNPLHTKNAAFNLMRLREIENYMTNRLRIEKHLFLNDVLEAIGEKHTPEGAIKGWIYGDGGDDFVSFGIDWEDAEKKPAVRRFLNGIEHTVWLDFNVDGIIWDKI